MLVSCLCRAVGVNDRNAELVARIASRARLGRRNPARLRAERSHDEGSRGSSGGRQRSSIPAVRGFSSRQAADLDELEVKRLDLG